MKSKKVIKESTEKIDEILELQKRVNATNDLADEIDAISLRINSLLFTTNNYVIDMKNFSIMNITPPQELR